jgi:hypothetical protein
LSLIFLRRRALPSATTAVPICRGARRRCGAHAGYLPLFAASAPFSVAAITVDLLPTDLLKDFFFFPQKTKSHKMLKPLVLAAAAAGALSAPSQQKEPGLAAVSLGWRLSWRA